MLDHGWLPHAYQDESIPPVRKTPDAWITSLDDGAPALAGWEHMDEQPRRLSDGQIVEFDEFTDHGCGTLTVNADRSYRTDPPMPAAANCICHDGEHVGDDIGAFVEDGLYAEPLAPGPYDIEYYHWTDKPIPFRFDAATRSFARVAKAEGT